MILLSWKTEHVHAVDLRFTKPNFQGVSIMCISVLKVTWVTTEWSNSIKQFRILWNIVYNKRESSLAFYHNGINSIYRTGLQCFLPHNTAFHDPQRELENTSEKHGIWHRWLWWERAICKNRGYICLSTWNPSQCLAILVWELVV